VLALFPGGCLKWQGLSSGPFHAALNSLESGARIPSTTALSVAPTVWNNKGSKRLPFTLHTPQLLSSLQEITSWGVSEHRTAFTPTAGKAESVIPTDANKQVKTLPRPG